MNDGHPADGKEKRFSSLLKLFGRGKRDEDVTEEIMDMVNESHEQGVLEENEAEMIGNIFEFGEKQASDVMTHRNNIVALDDDITVREAFDKVMEENYSRYPVYDGDIDNITGILHIRDLLKIYVDKDNQDRKLRDVEDTVLFKPYCIPETRNISPLFRQMQSEKIHMAVVVDEYGQTAGIVTMEDILEEIVGNILDEYDEEEEQIVTDADGSYIIEGQAELEDVEDTIRHLIIRKAERYCAIILASATPDTPILHTITKNRFNIILTIPAVIRYISGLFVSPTALSTPFPKLYMASAGEPHRYIIR